MLKMAASLFTLPVPKIPHLFLSPSVAKSRAIIVGDIHGCLLEFQDILKKCSYNSADTTLILVGDLVNKGPYSLEVVKYARELNAYCVRGNHDEHVLSYIFNVNPKPRPDSYNYIDKFDSDDIEWLKELPYSITIPSLDSIVVHAGLVPHKPLPQQSFVDMTIMRNLVYTEVSTTSVPIPTENADNMKVAILPDTREDFSQLESDSACIVNPQDDCVTTTDDNNRVTCSTHDTRDTHITSTHPACTATSDPKIGVPWASMWKGPSHVYFGHDAKRGLQQYEYATGLDTGCCYGRKLSAVILPSREIVQIDARETYSPVTGKD